ncbi:MAG: nicotinate (nicotinamide) nucleotide adenylyltransferase [Oscillospiraceae bacterium]
MRIGIYGGTFDPIHLGHLAAAKTVTEELALDRLLLIPAALPPHKALAEQSASAAERLEMARLGAESLRLPEVEVSDIEMRREGPSYTVDTLRALRAQYPEAELWLLVGTDMLRSFAHWWEPGEILRLAGLCAFGRHEEDTEGGLAAAAEELRRAFPGARVRTLTLPNLVEISSTELRQGLAEGRGEEFLPPAVYGYILRRGLYGTKADLKHLTLDELRPVALSFLKGKRVPHVLGTERTAAYLAEKYGADVEAARRAALLHDCTKRLSMDEQLALCELYGIQLDKLEQKALKLLHARTGAALAKDLFGESDEVASAIRWHTTGKADMTKLEKVIYLADYIEPTRDFPGVEELRRVCERDLNEGLRLGLAMTVEEMTAMGSPVHEKTLEALAYLKGKTL